MRSIGDVDTRTGGIGRAGQMSAKTFPLETGVRGVCMEAAWIKYMPGYGTPRPEHSFNQFRFALERPPEIQDRVLQPGDAALYPQGVHHGPQLQTRESTALISQFVGPNGCPYLTHTELMAAERSLKFAGAIVDGGTCTQIMPDSRKVDRHGHAACYEAVVGHPPRFPSGSSAFRIAGCWA